jgi:hypothetical protein
LFGSFPDASFGTGVTISKDGDTVAVGSPDFSQINLNTGIVQVYEYGVQDGADGETWNQKGSDIMPPTDLTGIKQFGYRVGLSDDGTSLAVAAPYSTNPNASSKTQAGALFVWDWDSNQNTWVIAVRGKYGASVGQQLGIKGIATDPSKLWLHAVDVNDNNYSFKVSLGQLSCGIANNALVRHNRLRLTLLTFVTNSSKVLAVIQMLHHYHQICLIKFNVSAVRGSSH